MCVFVDIVIPVYNEERTLEKSITILNSFLKANFSYKWHIMIVDNASTDKTAKIGRRLQAIHQNVSFLHLDKKGRGRALRKAWLESEADIVSYMDVDLSTSLEAFPKLIDAIVRGYDIAIGSRLVKGSRIKRSFMREFLSRAYNLLLKLLLQTHFNDAQCGFKAMSRRTVRIIVQRIQNRDWFFDTELLVLGEKYGLKIKEIPVEWREKQFSGRGSTVKIVQTILEDISGALRLFFTIKRWYRIPSRNEKNS